MNTESQLPNRDALLKQIYARQSQKKGNKKQTRKESAKHAQTGHFTSATVRHITGDLIKPKVGRDILTPSNRASISEVDARDGITILAAAESLPADRFVSAENMWRSRSTRITKDT